MATMKRKKPSEYGGSDTHTRETLDTYGTLGIQPAPHEPDVNEQLRIMYSQDPSDTGLEQE